MRRVGSLLVVSALGMIGALALVAPASATDDKEKTQSRPKDTVCKYVTDWDMRSVKDNEWGKPVHGSFSTDDFAVLAKKPGYGTEFANMNVGLGSDEGVAKDLKVTVKLFGGASAESGALRMFYYTTANPDTNVAPPSGSVVADGNGEITIPDVKKIGTLGFTFDNSNQSSGSVKFSNLTWGGEKLDFYYKSCTPIPPTFVDANCDGPAKLTIPDSKSMHVKYKLNETFVNKGVIELEDVATYTVKAVLKPGAKLAKDAKDTWEFKVTQPNCETPTTPPATNPPTVPPVDNGGNAGGLPVTGPQAAIIGGVGGLVLAVGAVLFVLARKRRVVTALPE